MALRLLATFPGRAGDLLWALPSIRAISEHFAAPVDLLVAGEFAGLVPLLLQQPYLASVEADPRWSLTPPDDWRAPEPIFLPPPLHGWDRVYHLGYRGWPANPLPHQTWSNIALGWRDEDGPLPSLDLDRPWIIPPPEPLLLGLDPATLPARDLIAGWTDCWFELKLGLWHLLADFAKDRPFLTLAAPGSRWDTEGGGWGIVPCGWIQAAHILSHAAVFLGDCSALHVLAVAMGKPVVLVEPMEARWNPIFFPLGTHDRVRLVRGNDGLPSFDARHCADVLKEALHGL